MFTRIQAVADGAGICRSCSVHLTVVWPHLGIRERLNVGAGLAAADEDEVGVAGGTQHLDDELELVDVVLAREQRLPVQQLRQDAPHRPAPALTSALTRRWSLPRKVRKAVPLRGRHAIEVWDMAAHEAADHNLHISRRSLQGTTAAMQTDRACVLTEEGHRGDLGSKDEHVQRRGGLACIGLV